MSRKTDIQVLVYRWANGDNTESRVAHEEVLEELQPHMNLKELKLKYFGGQRFASWMANRDARLLQNLVKIKLKDCRLCEQVPILGHLPHLEIVEMNGLDNVKCIGSEFYGLGAGVNTNTTSSGAAAAGAVFPALRKLTIDNMLKLEEWSDLSSLPAAVTTSMKEFFPCLEMVSISECPLLITIPGNLLSIQTVMISSSDSLFDVETIHSRSLNLMVHEDSENILVLLEDLLEKSNKSLRSLGISGLDELCYFPTQLQNLTSLEKLRIECCENLRSEDTQAASLNRLTSLKQLWISYCNELRCLPKGLLQPTLDTLELECCTKLVMTESDELCSLTSLQNLRIQDCSRLASCWGEGLFCVSSLQKLVIGGFSPELDHFPWPSTSADAANVEVLWQCPFISLESLSLWDSRKHLPDQLQGLTALKKLEIRGFTELEALPEWLGNLSSLQSLTLRSCPKLMSLSSLEATPGLTNLIVYDCPLLKKRCKSGKEGHAIAHIPSVQIIDW